MPQPNEMLNWPTEKVAIFAGLLTAEFILTGPLLPIGEIVEGIQAVSENERDFFFRLAAYMRPQIREAIWQNRFDAVETLFKTKEGSS